MSDQSGTIEADEITIGPAKCIDRGATIERVTAAGLCMQCGTCAGICPRAAITMDWSVREGYMPVVTHPRCDGCGDCLAVCPGEGFDYSPGAWWRARNRDAPSQDFLGPWNGLWFGWATDPDVRYAGASGGIATAILEGALKNGAVDAGLVVGMDPRNPLATRPVIARTPEEISACRGSKYNAVAVNTLLRRILREPGRYAAVGLPCHIQGLRLAIRRYPDLEGRIAFTLGIFCGWTALPRATEVALRRSGMDPSRVTSVGYRGPDWPGGLHVTDLAGHTHTRPYPDYFDHWVYAYTPSRCHLCPDALAELADISVGDAWLDRFAGTPGVSDLITRTETGRAVVEELTPSHLTLQEATPDEIVASQSETYTFKRDIYRGRRWLHALTGRSVPEYPGVATAASAGDRVAGLRNFADEGVHRLLGDIRYR